MSADEPQAPLPLRIPDIDPPWLEAYLAEHPEEREWFAELRRRDREERRFAELVIRDVYGHYTTGVPSSWGLRISLRGYLGLLEEESVQLPWRKTGEMGDLADELTETRTQLATGLQRPELERYAQHLQDVAEQLLNDLEDAWVALIVEERIGRHRTRQARSEALQQAATLVRHAAEEVERLAAAAAPGPPIAVDDLAAEFGFGVEPGPPDPPAAEEPD